MRIGIQIGNQKYSETARQNVNSEMGIRLIKKNECMNLSRKKKEESSQSVQFRNQLIISRTLQGSWELSNFKSGKQVQQCRNSRNRSRTIYSITDMTLKVQNRDLPKCNKSFDYDPIFGGRLTEKADNK